MPWCGEPGKSPERVSRELLRISTKHGEYGRRASVEESVVQPVNEWEDGEMVKHVLSRTLSEEVFAKELQGVILPSKIWEMGDIHGHLFLRHERSGLV